MDLKTFQREFRKKLKDEGKKIVISKDQLKVTIYPWEGKKKNYASKAKIIDDEKTLRIISLEETGREWNFEGVYYILYYWVNYASAHDLEIVTFHKSILTQRKSWSYANRIKEERLDFTPKMGFVIDEENYTLEIKNVKEVLPIYQKIKKFFQEKRKKEVTMSLISQELDEVGVIYRTLLNWLGHKAYISVSYNLKTDSYEIGDKKIVLKSEESELEEKIEEYFERVKKMRKIKNIYEPPIDNLSKLISGISSNLIDAKHVMDLFLEKGYTNLEIEEEAATLFKDEKLKEKVVKIGYYRVEVFLKFLNHYLMIYAKPGPGWEVKIFDDKDEMFEYYYNEVNKNIVSIIDEKKKVI